MSVDQNTPDKPNPLALTAEDIALINDYVQKHPHHVFQIPGVCHLVAGMRFKRTKPEDIRGLDLISYSDMVDLGDMHDMPYDDNSFDVITISGVLAYSSDNAQVAREVRRVARSRAYVAVGCEYNPSSNEKLNAIRDIKMVGTRYYSTDDVLKPSEDYVGTIYFRNDIHPSLRHIGGFQMVVFQTID